MKGGAERVSERGGDRLEREGGEGGTKEGIRAEGERVSGREGKEER